MSQPAWKPTQPAEGLARVQVRPARLASKRLATSAKQSTMVRMPRPASRQASGLQRARAGAARSAGMPKIDAADDAVDDGRGEVPAADGADEAGPRPDAGGRAGRPGEPGMGPATMTWRPLGSATAWPARARGRGHNRRLPRRKGAPMPRVVRCGLIQARNVKGPEAGLPAIKKAMVDKHVKLIEQAATQEGPDPLPAGAVLRPLLLRRAGDEVVPPHRARARRAHRRSSCRSWPGSTGW